MNVICISNLLRTLVIVVAADIHCVCLSKCAAPYRQWLAFFVPNAVLVFIGERLDGLAMHHALMEPKNTTRPGASLAVLFRQVRVVPDVAFHTARMSSACFCACSV